MDEDLIVREIIFNGDSLLAMKDINNNKIYVGVSFVCNGIGLNENQRDRQVKNIQKDIVLQNSIKNLPVKYDGQIRNVICIELDYLPLWLAKISITPLMRDNNPDVVNKLIEYQLRAKDILAKEFVLKEKFTIPETYSEALKLASGLQKQLEEQKPKIEMFDEFMKSEDGIDMDEVANILKLTNMGRTKLFRWLKQQKILMSGERNNIPYSTYSRYFDVIEVSRNGMNFSKTLVRPNGIAFIRKRLNKEKRLLEAVIN